MSTIMLVATFGLFCSTAIQVGFALNLHVPTVPLDISMTADEAYALPGLAARGWAAGTCIMFAVIAVLGIFDRIPRQVAHNVIGTALFLTLLPIVFAFFDGRLPAGASWIFWHHVSSGTLIFLTRPSMRSWLW